MENDLALELPIPYLEGLLTDLLRLRSWIEFEEFLPSDEEDSGFRKATERQKKIVTQDIWARFMNMSVQETTELLAIAWFGKDALAAEERGYYLYTRLEQAREVIFRAQLDTKYIHAIYQHNECDLFSWLYEGFKRDGWPIPSDNEFKADFT